MGRFFRFMSGAIIGAFVGGAVVILLAPASGQTLRARIYQNLNNLLDEVNQASLEKRAELEKELSDLRGNIQIG